MSATIIIPQYGRADLTLACIASIRQHDPHSWPILIIDDGSPDDSARQLAQSFQLQAAHSLPAPATMLVGSQCLSKFSSNPSHITLLHQPHRGLTAAWNAAAHHATTSILVFLNNDTLASGPFVQSLINPLLRETAFPAVESTPCGTIPAATPLLTGIRWRSERSLPAHVVRRLPTTQFLEGWCFAVRRDDLMRLDGFDESMRLYWSDTDLQCRLLQSHLADSNRLPSRAGDLSPPTPATSLIAFPDLPVRHLGHRTTHADPTHLRQWKIDRDAFVARWDGRQVQESCPVRPTRRVST